MGSAGARTNAGRPIMEGTGCAFKTQHDHRGRWRDSIKRGDWCRAIDVRDFIVRNVSPYSGDEDFLAGSSSAQRRSGRSCNLISRRNERRASSPSTRKTPPTMLAHEARLHRSRQRSDCRVADRPAVQAGHLPVRRPAHGRGGPEGGRFRGRIRRSTRPSRNTAKPTTTACSTLIRRRS